MPRPFLYVVLMMFAAVGAAFSYRTYQDDRCCESPLSTVAGDQPIAPLSQGEPTKLPSARPVVLAE